MLRSAAQRRENGRAYPSAARSRLGALTKTTGAARLKLRPFKSLAELCWLRQLTTDFLWLNIPSIFKELSYVFIAAILGGAVAWRLRQPLILGYVVAGIALSPYTPGPRVRETHTFQIVAEVGVVFLMFSIGLEFSIAELMEVKWMSLIGAPLGVVLLSLMSAGVALAAGLGRDVRAGDGDDHFRRQYHGAVAAADRSTGNCSRRTARS